MAVRTGERRGIGEAVGSVDSIDVAADLALRCPGASGGAAAWQDSVAHKDEAAVGTFPVVLGSAAQACGRRRSLQGG